MKLKDVEIIGLDLIITRGIFSSRIEHQTTNRRVQMTLGERFANSQAAEKLGLIRIIPGLRDRRYSKLR